MKYTSFRANQIGGFAGSPVVNREVTIKALAQVLYKRIANRETDIPRSKDVNPLIATQGISGSGKSRLLAWIAELLEPSQPDELSNLLASEAFPTLSVECQHEVKLYLSNVIPIVVSYNGQHPIQNLDKSKEGAQTGFALRILFA
jgi:hypothetical protein